MPLTLPPFIRSLKLVEADGTPTIQMQQFMQAYSAAIISNDTAQAALLDEIAEILGLTDALETAVEAAQDSADTATAAAATAQSAADGANSVASLTNSGVTGLTLGASDAGASATITISAHTRVYGDGTSLAITGASITGLAYSTVYYVYYDDPTRADTTPSFLTTTSDTTAAQTGDRHLVGRVTTPAAAAPPNSGDGVQPPGIGNIP